MKYDSGNKRDERTVVAALKRGEVWAFDTVYNEYFSIIYQYSRRLLKSSLEAEDVTQEVFMRLWAGRESIRSEESVRPLLFISARNLLASCLRKRMSTPIFEDYLEYVNHLPESEHRPVEFDEFLENVMKHIDGLPGSQPKVVRLSKFEHKSNKEIASILGMNEQSVKNSLSQGLKTLRIKLGLIVPTICLIASLAIAMIRSYVDYEFFRIFS